ncbi:condensation domain-containing protein, partial [Streptomyces sp. wa22]|uniref:condensation domain-containing protein n=1 Tax=Streptomyces sp. wa22 TaxID=1828244 RepID=UPI0012BFFF97
MLRTPAVRTDDDFFALGGDSILSIQLVSRVREAGLGVTPRDVFVHRTPEAIAAVATELGRAAAVPAGQGTGQMPPTPIAAWFLERPGTTDGYNQSGVLRTPAGAYEDALVATLQLVLDQHDMLRLRATRPAGGAPVLEALPPGSVRARDRFTRVDVAGLDGDAVRAAVTEAGEQARRRLRPAHGEVVEAVWCDAGPRARGRLLLVVHHLAVDAVSWRILATDVAAAWQAVTEAPDATGRAALPAPTTSYRQWARLLATQAHEPSRESELPLWQPLWQPQERPDLLPLSYAQQRLWFLHRLEGPSATYNIPFALRLDGPLDAEALRRALHDVLGRHAALRTVFPEHDSRPHQRITAPDDVRLPLAVETVDEDRLPARIAAAATAPIDIEHRLPLRATLLRLDDTAHVLVLAIHHIAADGSSLAPFARDLGAAYRARVRAGAPQWTDLPVDYADHTLWQRRLLGDESDPDSLVARQLVHWKDALDGLPEMIELPWDRSRPAAPRHTGATHDFALDPATARQVADLARTSGCSVFMVLQAALSVVLSRHGAGDDIPLGTAVAGRTDEAAADLVGLFVNTLVLRTDLTGDPTFLELLHRVKEFDLSAYAHQDVPFERLVELLNPARSQNHHPLFQTMLILQNHTPAAPVDLPGVTTRGIPVDPGVSKFDLSFTFTETYDDDGTPSGMRAAVDYATELFDASTVRDLAGRLVLLITAATADPDRPLSTYDVLTAAERDRLTAWGTGPADDGPGSTVPALFEQWARRTPDAPAVRDAGTTLTYGELDSRADALARRLAARGIGPEDRVAVALPRTAELVVALLGILKAGAAYVPLDPDYPARRLSHMLDDSRPRLLLTTPAVRSRLPETSVPCLYAGDHEDSAPTSAYPPALLPAHPAYVIYTSGSTGRPKGVVVTHRGAGAMARTQRERLRVTPGSRVLHMASVSFDAAFWELCMGLLSGACLEIDEREALLPGPALAALVRERGVTHLTRSPGRSSRTTAQA